MPLFNEAVERLTVGGVSGPVVFNVKSATYAEQVIVRAVRGASAANTITFQSAAGNADSVIVDHPTGANTAVIKSGQCQLYYFQAPYRNIGSCKQQRV